MSCWLGQKGLGWIRGWSETDLMASLGEYRDIELELQMVLQSAARPEGIQAVRFLKNRIAGSAVHLSGMLELNHLLDFAEDQNPRSLTEEQKIKVAEACSKAEQYSRQYLMLLSQCVPDRGGEGTIVSYAATIPVYIAHIREYFVNGEQECPHRPASLDAPPPPAAG